MALLKSRMSRERTRPVQKHGSEDPLPSSRRNIPVRILVNDPSSMSTPSLDRERHARSAIPVRHPAIPEPRASRPSDARQSKEMAAFEYSSMIGSSAVMRAIYEQIGQVARTNATALLRGESGTGKEIVAQAIHANSARAHQPFVKVNCAALPETLFESELFGHERGAFTGAHAKRAGRFELAQGGTLFLDEVGELPLATQVKLLRVLQTRDFERLGGTETLRADARLVAATNRDLEGAIAAGTFREDLYYRLNVFSITVPPLRARPSDIPHLSEHFLAKYAEEHGKRASRIGTAAMDALSQHAWPGNVRELENVIERSVVVCSDSVVELEHLPESLRVAASKGGEPRPTLASAVEALERRLIEEALQDARGSVMQAARALGATERIVRYKATKYGIEATRFR
jgi:Nif-specific regulatory protein